jgi:hypothetical protein
MKMMGSPTHRKKSQRNQNVYRYIVATCLLTALGAAFHFYDSSENKLQPLSPTAANTQEQETKENLFSEASAKRFNITDAKILKAVDKAAVSEVKSSLSREVMITKLLAEVLDQKPELVKEAEERVLSSSPKILTLAQKIEGETNRQTFIVSDTRKCAKTYEVAATHTVRLNELFSNYCVDPAFDYPGGFDENEPIEISILAIDSRNGIEGLDNDYDKLVKVKLRGIVKDDFVKRYQETGKLTYVD